MMAVKFVTPSAFLLLIVSASSAFDHNITRNVVKRSNTHTDGTFGSYTEQDLFHNSDPYSSQYETKDTEEYSGILSNGEGSRRQFIDSGYTTEGQLFPSGVHLIRRSMLRSAGHFHVITDNYTVLPSKFFQRWVLQPTQTSAVTDLSSLVQSLSHLKVGVANPMVKMVKIGNYAPSGTINLFSPIMKTQDMIPWAPGVLSIDFKLCLNIPIQMAGATPGVSVSPVAPELPPTPPERAQLPLQDVVVIVLQMAATFRRNIVTVVGYVLNNHNIRLSPELHMALREIYTCARLRQIKVADILPVLQVISMQEPQQQCISILKELLRVSPPHVQSSIRLWLAVLQSQKINVNHVFRPNNQALVIDFLAGIDFTYLNILTHRVMFPPEIAQYAPQDVATAMGKLFAQVCGALAHGSLRLTQSLLAVFLLHIQPNRHTPEVEENLMFLADVFFREKKELEFAFSQLDRNMMKNPYDFIHAVLVKINQIKGLDVSIRDAIQLCFMYLKKSSYVVIDNDFRKYFMFPSAADVDLRLCFSIITPGEYPADIIKIRDHILTAILKKEIDVNECLAGFVPHDYVHPVDMLLAIIERIRKRAVIPTYLVHSVSSLYVHVKLKAMSLNMETRPPRGFEDISFLFDSFKSPSIAEKVRVMALQILECLRQEKAINWNAILKEYPLHIWSRPRQLVVSILNHVITSYVIKVPTTITYIAEFLKEVEQDGEPKNCPMVTCPGQFPPIYIPVPVYPGFATRPPTTQTPPPQPAAPQRPSIVNVDAVELIKALSPQAIDDPRMEILVKFITSSQLLEIIGRDFDVLTYPTTGALLKAILERCVQSNKLDNELAQVLQYWLGKISQDGYGGTKVNFYTKTVEETRITVNMNSVLRALDLNRLMSEGKIGAYVEFSKFLTDHFNPKVHLEDFDFVKLKTSGEFLSAFFKHLQECSAVSPRYKNAITELMCCVQTNGSGMLPVETLL